MSWNEGESSTTSWGGGEESSTTGDQPPVNNKQKTKPKAMAGFPAAIGLFEGRTNPKVSSLFGGSQIKVGEKSLFPNNTKTKIFVQRSGPDHVPHMGLVLVIEHGEIGSREAGCYHDVSCAIIPTKEYKLWFTVPVKGTQLVSFPLSADKKGKNFVGSPEQLSDPLILDAVKAGMFRCPALLLMGFPRNADSRKIGSQLAAVIILLNDNQFSLVTYPPTVAEGPNFGIVHRNETFDGAMTISRILASSGIIAYIPMKNLSLLVDAFNYGKEVKPIDRSCPYGLPPM
jgi:hypothetical protein